MGTFLKLFAIIAIIWGMSKFSYSSRLDNTVSRGREKIAQRGNRCLDRACYPPRGNLIVGRANGLSASSTCGLNGEEKYCLPDPYSRKCFRCNSRPGFSNSPSLYHGVEQLVPLERFNRSSFLFPRWWQSESGVENVILQLNFEEEFDISFILIFFKSLRPKAMYIEKSRDFGNSWTTVRYFAQNCSEIFPGIPTGPPRRHSDVICDYRYSDIDPLTEGELIHRILPAHLKVVNPYDPEIQNLIKMTNIRFRFVKLHTFNGDEPSGENKENYFYAIKQLIVSGSCSCNGHADKCIPRSQGQYPQNMVHSKCNCQHNTKGNHCETCIREFDVPWKPAFDRDVNMCKNQI